MTDVEEQVKPLGAPQLYKKCERVWEKMYEESFIIVDDDLGEVRVWEGFITKLFNELGYGTGPYQTKIRSALQNMDCMEQVHRGAGSIPSRWVLKEPPTPTLFNLSRSDRAKNMKSSSPNVIRQRIDDLTNRVTRLEQRAGI